MRSGSSTNIPAEALWTKANVKKDKDMRKDEKCPRSKNSKFKNVHMFVVIPSHDALFWLNLLKISGVNLKFC